MELLIVVVLIIVSIVLLGIILGFNFKKAKSLQEDKTLEKLINKFPDNITVAKEMLKSLNNEKVKFTENYDAYKEIDYDQIFLTSNGAVYVKDGVFYKVYNNYLKNPIYLFEAKNVQDIKVKEDNIYYINDQFLYRYNDYGNVKILKREQFKYDYTNIYDVYFEE